MSVVLATTWSLKSACVVGSILVSTSTFMQYVLVLFDANVLFPIANLKATKYASSAMLRATEPCDNGKVDRFDGLAVLPHGAVSVRPICQSPSRFYFV